MSFTQNNMNSINNTMSQLKMLSIPTEKKQQVSKCLNLIAEGYDTCAQKAKDIADGLRIRAKYYHERLKKLSWTYQK